MSLRVVLYAEGGRETFGEVWRAPTPGEPLPLDQLGPAHSLVSRIIEQELNVPQAAVQFFGPLLSRGRTVRGSLLRNRAVLREILTWPQGRRRPDLAIVLVDADDDAERLRTLEGYVESVPIAKAVGVADPEFEAWLLADLEAVREAVGDPAVQLPPNIGSFLPREAKALLARMCTERDRNNDEIRRTLAGTCDLGRIANASPSFAKFARAIRRSRD